MAVSQLGERMCLFGLSWWVLVTTSSAAITGAVMAAFTAPLIVFGSLAGVLADRVSRKTIIVAADALRGLLMVIVWRLVASGSLDTWHVLAVVACSSTLAAFFNPAGQAAIPQVAGRQQLTRANSFAEIAAQLSGLLGPALGGLLYGVSGLGSLALVSGSAFLLSAFSETFIRLGPPAGSRAGGFAAQWTDGWRYVRSRPLVHHIVLVSCAIAFFSTPVLLALQTMLRLVLGADAIQAGILGSALAAGMLCGALLFGLKQEGRKYRVTLGALLGAGVLVAAMALARSLPVLAGLVAAWGFALAVGSVNARALLQQSIPAEVMGRVFGLLLSVNMALGPLAYALTGLAIDATSAPLVLLVLALGMTASVLFVPFIPGIRDH
ncbi:MAG: MFS transporter [bacterium]|nr:MFS transporter [bacterium]